MTTGNLIDDIRAANLNVYRASPSRLREDVGSEAEIAHDYQGRLIYELLQNADDAMGGATFGHGDRIRFRVTDDALLVMNTGRPLTEADVRGLTSTGASSKTGPIEGGGRASIGHKGMGFKSILEITDRPEIYSSTYAFVLDGERALPVVNDVLVQMGEALSSRVPTMRFPWVADALPESWPLAVDDGFNVLFRFPWKAGIDPVKVTNLAESLLALPATTILFLKNLEIVEIEVETSQVSRRISWSVRRDVWTPGGWRPSEGLTESGLYQVWIQSDGDTDSWCFLLEHEDRIVIGPHRGGLNDYAWAGVDLSEVSVAALITGGETDELPAAWRRFHVFLPTHEVSPYPLLVNGAFATDLSRQEIPVLPENEDYNYALITSAAEVLVHRLLPAVATHAGGLEAALRLLSRDQRQETPAGRNSTSDVFHRAVVDALSQAKLIPTGAEEPACIGDTCVPATFGHPTIGREMRDLLSEREHSGGRAVPVASLCAEPFAGILIDHGAVALGSSQTVELLSRAKPEAARLETHKSGKIAVDPVLRILQSLWENADKTSREELEQSARTVPLFPVASTPDGGVERIAVGDTETFFPPRGLQGDIPLPGLRFMLRDLCWGSLTPRERTEVLRAQMPAWVALFQVQEFKFPAVMRVSVLPALALTASEEERAVLAHWDILTAVCQLAGPTPSPDAPLPYGRLGSQRALFNLCRMPVPCQGEGGIEWVPAYRAYFGSAWFEDAPTEDASIEPLVNAVKSVRPSPDLRLPVVVPPAEFVEHLELMRGLRSAIDDEVSDIDDDEVGVDDDDEQATEADSRERWLSFLTWLGVNHVLRPVPFHDAEDRAKGWTSTKGLARPAGSAFAGLTGIWDAYSEQLSASLEQGDGGQHDRYFYRLHDLERLDHFCARAAEDAKGIVATALFRHLSLNWGRLERFTDVEIAFLAPGTYPSRRVDPPRADAKELRRCGPDLWLFRLQRAAFCPTLLGPQRPELTWWRSSEVKRRFDRRGSSADALLPVLTEVACTPQAKKFSQVVGVRSELTPASFTLTDAAALVGQLKLHHGKSVDSLSADILRNQINPAYQNLFELLSGSATDKSHAASDLAALRSSELLVHDARGRYRFQRADTVLFAARSGVREVQGIDAELWTFVLEGRPASLAPLRELFGARNVEDVLEWRLERDENALDDEGDIAFRDGLSNLAPYLLARLRVERAEEERAARDASRLREFVQNVTPVRQLHVACTLQGEQLMRAAPRQAFVDRSTGAPRAFVRWGENPWPPDPSEAEALAAAITDVLEVSYFEPLLALLVADGPGRDRLLHLAGATNNLEGARDTLNLEGSEDAVIDDPEQLLPKPTPGVSLDAEDGGSTTLRVAGLAASARVRLVDVRSLMLSGDPIMEVGTGEGQAPPVKSRQDDRGGSGSTHATSAYGGGTDLGELDRIGMYVATIFEQRRLRKAGVAATVFDPDSPRTTDAVFDVSTPLAVSKAMAGSGRFTQAMERLRVWGISVDAPGFDILTLDEKEESDLGRLIELKSSGVNARSLDMTWNEWKSARTDELRRHFYLYLVGNLRADIDAAPFIRAIRDPFGELLATEKSDRSARRKVSLDVQAFGQAEFQSLEVRSDA